MIYANIYTDGHSKNSLFGFHDPIHRHNPTLTPRILRETFLAQGVEVNTPDLNEKRQVSFDLHLEARPIPQGLSKKYLIALENPYINPLNCNRELISQFDKVFSWDVRVHDMKNVIPILYPHPMIADEPSPSETRNIFSCLINANKAYKDVSPGDLYQERLKTIRWYEENAPDKFELYGLGWDKATPAFTFHGRLLRSVSQAKKKMLGIAPFPSYKGEIPFKAEILKKAVFSYCYENSAGLDNYITEKIFDSLISGCIPIYWGASNIKQHIPENCFVDRTLFKSTAEVHEYISNLTTAEHAAYRKNISRFLKTEKASLFSATSFSNTIVKEICSDMGIPFQPHHSTPDSQ